MINPYEVLQVDGDADLGTIRARYRGLAKTHHPDAGGDRDEWERLTLAHDVLTDPDRRARYDATGQIDEIREDSDRQQAFALVAEQIMAIADSFVRANFDQRHDPRPTKVLESVRRTIVHDLDGAESALAVGRKSLDFMRDYIKRIARRKGAAGIDQVEAILRQKVSMIEQRIVSVEQVVRVRKIALDVLGEYSFESDPPPATSVYGVGQTFTVETPHGTFSGVTSET